MAITEMLWLEVYVHSDTLKMLRLKTKCTKLITVEIAAAGQQIAEQVVWIGREATLPEK